VLPFVGTTLDLTPNLTAYASFATIFNPQTDVDVDNRVLSPIKGNNLELGIKGAWFGGRMNATAAIFQTRQDNTAAYAGFAAGRSYYTGVDARSQGIELDVGGQIAPGLQITGGYTLMRVDGEDGGPVRTFVPRNTGRLSVSYAPPSLDRHAGTGADHAGQLRVARPARQLPPDRKCFAQRQSAERHEQPVYHWLDVRPELLRRAADGARNDQRPLLMLLPLVRQEEIGH
jgi:outer membrane receptor for ferric coprogen and ferric-rhodotorulic acid